jgi:hypothetical protein
MPTNNPSLHYIDGGHCAPTGGHENCERFWAGIKAQHSATYGDESAYNFAICNAHGIRMEGRGWDRSSAANGQENGVDYNPGSRALVMLVCGDDDLTPQLKAGVNAFAHEAVEQHGMEWPLKAHSDFVATTCCGDHGRALVAEVNAGTIGDDEVTPEQMAELGRWMKEQRTLTEQYVNDLVDKKIGQWLKDTENRIVARLGGK